VFWSPDDRSPLVSIATAQAVSTSRATARRLSATWTAYALGYCAFKGAGRGFAPTGSPSERPGRSKVRRYPICLARPRIVGSSMDATPSTPDRSGHADADLLASVFEERAEYLSRRELSEWTAEAPRDREILAKLQGPGAKLLIGPRGSGKSTLLKRAYFRLLDSADVLPAYVNYARSLALEPLFHHNANALALFRQWVVFKIIDGVYLGGYELLGTEERLPASLRRLHEAGSHYIRALEVGVESEPSEMVAPSSLLALLEEWTRELRCRRCVLLLDDAAHAFSPEQQREFFEIFRELRSRVVSAKAAVYPGITSYSPYFQIGHEGELVEAWIRPDEPGYLEMMRQIADKRLPDLLRDRLRGREELIDYVALASFGIPRGFLNMLSELLGVEEQETSAPSRQGASSAVSHHAGSVREIFVALAIKLPRFKRFIAVGRDLQASMVEALQRFNATRPVSRKAVTMGIAEPLGPELERIFSFLEYAGLVRKSETVSRGEKGVFQRYAVHYALVLSENALSLGKSYPLQAALAALQSRDAHAFVRSRGSTLLGADFARRCTLDLEPCRFCGAPRPSPDAHFCMRCGRPLTEASVYEELLKASIDALGLTPNKTIGLKKHTSIRTVQDILLDDEMKSLRAVPYIGPVWAARIRRYAEEFVSV
jgi:hypothetical protein